MISISKQLYDAVIYKENNPDQSLTLIAEKFNVDRHSIAKYDSEYLKKNFKYKYDNKIYYIQPKEKEPVEYFIDHPDLSLAAVAKKFHCKTDTIKRRMVVMGYKYETRYKRKFNRNKFNQVTTPEEAYWLGFLLADGYINEDRGFIKIKLAIKDKEHLYKFANFMEEKDPMLIEETGGAYNKSNPCISIEFDSRQLINNLLKYNLHQAKSTKEQPYCFNDNELDSAYIRGMIDGDGHIEENFLKYVGSLESCLYIKNYLEKYIEYNQTAKYIYEYGTIYCFELHRNNIKEILKNIYPKNCIALDRKYKILWPC